MTAYKPINENSPRSPLGHLESDIEMDKIYDQDDANLSDIADKLLEGLEEDFDDEAAQSPKVRKLLYTVLVFSVIGGFSTLAYYAYQFGRKPVDASQLQLVKADNEPYKEKPADPGGMEVPNMDKTVYDSISGDNKTLPKVERILPPPEEPMSPSQPVVYESVADSPAEAKRKITVTNSREALLANKAIENNEIKPVVVKAEPEDTVKSSSAEELKKEVAVKKEIPQQKVIADISSVKTVTPKTEPVKAEETQQAVSGLKPMSEEDLQVVPDGSKMVKTVSAPAKTNAAKYRVQLGAYRSESDAAREWTRLTRQFPELKGLEYFVERKDLGAKGIFYRLQAGPFDGSADARMTCKKLVESKQGCFFVEAQ